MKHGNTLIMQSTRFKHKYYTPVSNIIEHNTAKEGERNATHWMKFYAFNEIM